MRTQFAQSEMVKVAEESVRASIEMDDQLSVEHVVQPNVDQTVNLEDIKKMIVSLPEKQKMEILNTLNPQLNGDGEDSVEQDLEGKGVETVMDD